MQNPLTDPFLNIQLSPPAPSETRPVLPQRKLLYPSPDNVPDSYVLELDNSSLEKFSTCPRAAENYLIRSREGSRSSSATAFGQLFHSCEELRLRHGLSEEVRQRQRELVHEHFLHFPVGPEEHRNATRMLDILDKYNSRYEDDSWPAKVLVHEGEKLVERAFKVELCTLDLNDEIPYQYEELCRVPPGLRDPTDPHYRFNTFKISTLHVLWTGRIDAVIADNENAIWVVDHKTSSIGGETYYEDFRLSSQTVGYAWAAQKLLKTSVLGLILNAIIIRRPSKTGTATEFDRKNFFYSPDRLAEWEENTKVMVADFVSNLLRGFYPQHTKWCMSKYGKCEYHENCSLPRAQRAADLSSSIYRDVTWNPTNH